MPALTVADSEVGTAELCQSLGVSRASLYRSRQPEVLQEPKPPRAAVSRPENAFTCHHIGPIAGREVQGE